jgi:hypothetical protein
VLRATVRPVNALSSVAGTLPAPWHPRGSQKVGELELVSVLPVPLPAAGSIPHGFSSPPSVAAAPAKSSSARRADCTVRVDA